MAGVSKLHGTAKRLEALLLGATRFKEHIWLKFTLGIAQTLLFYDNWIKQWRAVLDFCECSHKSFIGAVCDKAYPAALDGTSGIVIYHSGARSMVSTTGTSQSLTAEACGSISIFRHLNQRFPAAAINWLCRGNVRFCGSNPRSNGNVEWNILSS
jgi:hypothetical protein